MSDFGTRLKQERQRLGLSQIKFAEACGIKRTAQTTYESGERSPDVDYLEAAGKLGVDVSFLLTGVCVTYDLMIENGAMGGVLYRLQGVLGIDDAELEQLVEEGENSLRALRNTKITEDDGYPERADKIINRWIDEAVLKCSVGIDSTLLSTILEELDLIGVHLSPSQKAHAAAMLYRAFKASGKVDQKMIEEAVKLAAG